MTTNAQALDQYAMSSFALQSIEDFPFVEFSYRQQEYHRLLHWYNGEKVREKMTVKGKSIEKYPLKINPLESIVLKHTAALFGEFKDDALPLVSPKLVLTGAALDNDAAKAAAQAAIDAVNTVWWESNGRSLQLENGLSSEVFGGCIFGIRYVPMEWAKFGGWRALPFRIERVDAMYFYAVPMPGDPVRLAEMWIVQPISWRDARLLGYNAKFNEPCWWIEHQTCASFEITINGQAPVFPHGAPASGPNPWGVVPYVYIPHWREGGFWGKSEIPPLEGLITEYNLRMADYGDAVAVDAHNYTAMRNVNATPRVVRVGELEIIDLSSAASITGAEKEPDLFEVHKASASAAMKDLIDLIWLQIGRDAKIPAVAYGEDEGSQRSGQTLVVRMWPLISHTNINRLFWDSGLNWLTRMLLTMMAKVGIPEIRPEHLGMRIKQVWAPVLPKDREQVVNEAVNRMINDAGSLDTVIDLFGDVEDKEREKALIMEFMKFKAEIEAKARPAPETAAGGTASKGSANSSGAKSKAPGGKS